MIGALVLSLFMTVAQEDSNELYLLDMSWATFSSRWDRAYDTSRYGVRSLQGCLDLERFYDIYQAKARVTVYRDFIIRYFYFHRDDYSDSTSLHRFEPVLRLGGDFYGHLMIEPNTWKRNDEIGTGVSWFADPLNYAEAFFIIRDFDNNFSLKETGPGPKKDVYVKGRFPFRFTVEARKEFPRFRFKLYGEAVTRAEKELQNPGDRRTTYFSSAATEGRVEGRLGDRLWLGTTFAYQGRGARTDFFSGTGHSFDSTIVDTLRKLVVEPYLDLTLGPRWSVNLKYRFTSTAHVNPDNPAGYLRRWDGIIGLAEYRLSRVTTFGFGYERSFRNYRLGGVPAPGYLKGKYDVQNRATLLVEFAFPHNVYLWIREGIELDGFPQTTFSLRFHNHTYAALMLSF